MKIMWWLILTFFAAACAPLTTTYPSTDIIIDVRDSVTHSPIHGALVVGSINVFYYPVMEDNMFGRGGEIPSFVAINEPSAWVVTTNHDGQATTTTAGGCPSNIAILADGYPMSRANFSTSPSGRVADATQWSQGMIDPASQDDLKVEFRIRTSPR